MPLQDAIDDGLTVDALMGCPNELSSFTNGANV